MQKAKRFFISFFAVLSILAYVRAWAESSQHSHWGYEGAEAPPYWGELDNQYRLCQNGEMQSPIDFNTKKLDSKSKFDDAIQLNYRISDFKVFDNGHTIQVGVEKGNHAIIHGKKFDLIQFHFHSSSEHTVDGYQFPLEMHLVHQNDEGQLAVIGVLFKAGVENASIAKIWKSIPAEKGKEYHFPISMNPERLLPKSHAHYHYVGSLTTPPCTEGVSWNVLNTPVELSQAQINQFRRYYFGNYRPVQKLYNRQPASY